MGEIIKCVKTALAQASDEFVAVQTLGGRMHVRWDHEAQATPHGQIVYFAEFLATAGIFDNWVNAFRPVKRMAGSGGLCMRPMRNTSIAMAWFTSRGRIG